MKKDKKMKQFDKSVTVEDFKRAQNLQNVIDFIFYQKSDSLRLIDSVVTFDEISTANVYFVRLLHNIDNVKDVIDCFNRCVKNICEFSIIASSGDYATKFVIVSHLSPLDFQSLLTERFNKLWTSSFK